MKRKYTLLLAAALLSLVSCNDEPVSSSLSSSNSTSSSISSNLAPTSISITFNGNAASELDATIGSSLTLGVKIDQTGYEDKVIWTSSDQSILTVSSGVVTPLKEGTAIVSATIEGYTYLSSSIFINVAPKVEQTGVGSGLSKDDPIFKGYEGGEEIEIYFLEMRQIYSDSIFIKKGNFEVLIDAGYPYDGLYISEFLKEHMPDGRLDMLMLSHSDGDHIDGLTNALADVENISLMIDYGGVNTGNVGKIREEYIAKGTKYYSAYDCVNYIGGASDRFYLTEDIYLDILDTGNYVTADESGASNPNSVTCIFNYKDFKFFTGGDLTSSSEADLLRRESLPHVTLFKAHHHGSSGSNSQALLDMLDPVGVAISAAIAGRYGQEPGPANPNNTYNLDGTSGHPHDEAIERIYNAPRLSENLNLYWSGVNGTMCFTSDGSDSFTFHGSPTMKGYYDLTLTNGTPVWDDEINDWKNKVTGEEDKKLHETKIFKFRNLEYTLPEKYQID